MTLFVAFGFLEEKREFRCGCRGGALLPWLDLSGNDRVCSGVRCGYWWDCLLEWLLFWRECSVRGKGLWSLFTGMGCD